MFCSQKRYATFEEFAADEPGHRVAPTAEDGAARCPYAWQPGVTKEMWGWVVQQGSARPAADGSAATMRRPAMRRVLRSWFEGAAAPEEEEEGEARNDGSGGDDARGGS